MNVSPDITQLPGASRRTSTIAYTGLVAGTLDALAAVIMYLAAVPGGNPVRIFQYIASAVFGKAAYAQGWIMPVLGLLFHYFIAFAFTLFYFWIYPKIRVLSRNMVISGLLYGIVVWVVMNLVIVPLTRIPQAPIQATKAIKGALVIMLAVGLPIAIGANRFYKQDSVNKPTIASPK